MPCPDENLLSACVDNALSPTERIQIEQHLDACPRCRALVSDLVRVRSLAPGPSAKPGGDRIGQTIAHFRIVGRLGSGGMGVVYRAFDEDLRRLVALKLLPEEGDPESRRRFLREARAAATVTHANVAAIYEVGEDQGEVYIAMEYVEGTTLRVHLSRGALPLFEALRIGAEIARGLAKVHEGRAVHRDLKPDNVMIDKDGHAKVLDFGLAKLGAAPGDGSDPGSAETSAQLTGAGMIMGTPGYLSPEQVRGQAADARSDVFAFGLLLYEMVTGTRAFAGQTVMELLIAVSRDEPVPASTRVPSVPPLLDRLLERCLRKDPDARYASCQELLGDLEALALSPAPLPGPRRWPLVLAAAGFMAGAALFGSALLLERPGTRAPRSPGTPGLVAVASGTAAGLTALFGTGPDDIWAVGRRGTVLRWDGVAWSAEECGTQDDLYGVWGQDGSLYVVGERGTVLVRRDSAFRPLGEGLGPARLDGVWADGSGAVWVVGQAGGIHRFRGSAWQREQSGTDQHLRGVWGSSGSDIWVVGGADNHGVVVHYDGATWRAQEMPLRLKGVGGTGPSDVYAVGGALEGENQGAVMHYDGRAWVRLPVPSGPGGGWLQGVWTEPGGETWIVGDNGIVLQLSRGTWWRLPVQRGGESTHFRAVWGTDGGPIWVVGTDGAIRRLGRSQEGSVR